VGLVSLVGGDAGVGTSRDEDMGEEASVGVSVGVGWGVAISGAWAS